VAFLKTAFGFREGVRTFIVTEKHAELSLGDSMIMLSEASEQYPANPTMIHLFVDKCDILYKRALEDGASSIKEPGVQEYGHRSASVSDDLGDQWWIASDIKG